ncbi:MAG: class I SAM-dependent methyltransferase [Anaerolineales bacterium]|nr:class I SAM-dependent methyltransferase [Anaerolineales bacterium]
MNIRNAYNQWSDSYDTDENLTRDLDQTVTRQVLGAMHLGKILETGCGTGKNTAFYAQIGAQVQALDFSEGMIARAREKVTADNVTFSVADLTQKWPCAAGTVDLVVCNLVLEHIADLDFIFAEAKQVLVPGEKFFISELHPFKQYGGSQAQFQQGGETTKVTAYVHHISDFVGAAAGQDFQLLELKEWWHERDEGQPPRLVTFMFQQVE